MKQDLPKLVFSTLLPNPNGSGYFKVMLLSDGSTTCTCGQCTPTVECEHIHPLVVEYLRSVERRDDVVEGIVEHRRDNTLAALRRQEIPRGTVLRLSLSQPSCSPASTSWARCCSSAEVCTKLRMPPPDTEKDLGMKALGDTGSADPLAPPKTTMSAPPSTASLASRLDATEYPGYSSSNRTWSAPAVEIETPRPDSHSR